MLYFSALYKRFAQSSPGPSLLGCPGSALGPCSSSLVPTESPLGAPVRVRSQVLLLHPLTTGLCPWILTAAGANGSCCHQSIQ